MPPARQARRPSQRGLVGLFPSTDSAQAFITEFSSTRRRGGLSRWSGLGFYSSMGSYGGIPYQSSYRRERLVFNYPSMVTHEDHRYLRQRDPTAKMLAELPALYTSFAPPETLVPALDDYFSLLEDLGFFEKLVMARDYAAVDGGSWLYVNATGNVDAPLTPGDEVLGFDVLTADQVDENPGNTILAPPGLRDPLVAQHGFEHVGFRNFYVGDGSTQPVHGSRLVNINLDRASRWWRGESIYDSLFDALWNFRDVEFAQKHAQIQGNPFGVFVDWESPFDLDQEDPDTGKTAGDEIAEDIVEFREGSRDFFAGIKGAEVKRVGAADLDDPDKFIRMEASRISHGSGGFFTPNHLLASSRGSEQVTDQDILTTASAVHIDRVLRVRRHLVHALRLGQLLNMAPRRAALPSYLREVCYWPRIRALTEVDELRVVRGVAESIRMAAQAGVTLPPIRTRGWEAITEDIDPAKLLPTVAVKREDPDAPPEVVRDE